jgi:hypothetical protein
MTLHCLLAGTEADWIRRAGVLVAIIGTGAAAPDGVSFGSRWIRNKTRQVIRWGWVRLARFLPWLRRSATVHPMAGSAVATSSAGGLVTVKPGWDPDAPLGSKVQRLHEQMVQAYADIEQVRQDAMAANAELGRRLEDRVGQLQASDQDLREMLEARERRAARVDSRGVFLIGLSIMMTGIPDGLAKIDWLGWLVVAGAITATALIVRAVRSDLGKAG